MPETYSTFSHGSSPVVGAMTKLRTQSIIALGFLMFLALMTTYSLRTGISGIEQVPEDVKFAGSPESSSQPPPPPAPQPEPEPEPEKHIIPDHPTYKPEKTTNLPPITDNFPLAAAAQSAADLPKIPRWNRVPVPHVPGKTPLFIGFTRNWRLLQQAVVSYITAGWPPEDIYVIENTGTMKSNELGLLSLQNPFFLNHTRLRMFGVNIVTTPTLLSFSQLQNFYIWMAIQNNFTTYFYGHMDVIVLPREDRHTPPPGDIPDTYTGFKSIYQRAVNTLRLATSSEPDPNSSKPSKPWAARFFSYDRLALVNREAYENIGGWDTSIPYYFSDCDMHDRLKMYGFEYNGPDVEIGDFFDVSWSLDDLLVLYRKQNTVQASFIVDHPPEDENKEKEKEERGMLLDRRNTWISDALGSTSYKQLFEVADMMTKLKNGGERNTWQSRQHGGKGEPYYRDSEGFEKAIAMLTQTGRDIYAEKWGHRTCELLPFGRKAGDEWRVEHDWE